MKDERNLHLKVQEMIDCYATTDPLKEMSEIQTDSDQEEAAIKWLALAALHGVNANAKKISITKAPDGEVTVTAKYRKSELPTPGAEVSRRIFSDIREITHIEGEEGKMPLSLGIRDASLQLQVKLKSEDDGEKVTLKFPE